MSAEQEAAWDTAQVSDEPGPPRYGAGVPICTAESPERGRYRISDMEGFGCTRRAGHLGQHVATVPGEVIAVWPADGGTP